MQEKEAKKEAFRKYLESSGTIDALTKGFVHYGCLVYMMNLDQIILMTNLWVSCSSCCVIRREWQASLCTWV